MENTHKKAEYTFKVVDGQKFDANAIWANFMATLMPAWEFLKTDPLNFILIFALPVVFGAVLLMVLVPLLIGSLIYGNLVLAGIVSLLVIVAFSLLKFFAYGCALRAITEKKKTNKIDLAGIMKFVSKHFVDSIKLAVKLFIFTQAWIPLAIAVAGGLLAAIGQLALAGIVMIAFPIVGLVVLYFNYGKMIRSSFSMLYFFESDTPKVEEAFKSSMAMGEGKTWTLFYNYFMIGLVVGIATSLVAGILRPVFGTITADSVTFSQEIAAAVLGSFSIIFQYFTKVEAEKLHGHKKQ